jgi:hypothetical protein
VLSCEIAIFICLCLVLVHLLCHICVLPCLCVTAVTWTLHLLPGFSIGLLLRVSNLGTFKGISAYCQGFCFYVIRFLMPFRNFISDVRVCTYIYIYDVILLWQLLAMKSFLDDNLYEGGRCHRSFWRLCLSSVHMSAQRHIFKMSPVDTHISKMLYMNSISTWPISWILSVLLSL